MLFLEGPGKFRFEIVGESYHQESLELLVGGRSKEGVKKFADAVVVCERDNPHDPLAVRVDIGGYAVGHFDREKARVYRRWLRGVGIAEEPCRCRAVIVGGWDRGGNRGSFAVKLDMPSIWKPKKSSPVGESSETEFDFAEEQETTNHVSCEAKAKKSVGFLRRCWVCHTFTALLKTWFDHSDSEKTGIFCHNSNLRTKDEEFPLNPSGYERVLPHRIAEQQRIRHLVPSHFGRHGRGHHGRDRATADRPRLPLLVRSGRRGELQEPPGRHSNPLTRPHADRANIPPPKR